MGATLTSFDAALRIVYGPRIVSLLNNKLDILKLFTKNADQTEGGGRSYIYPIHTSRNPGVGSVGEDKTLPTAQSQGLVDVTIPYRYSYARIRLTEQVIKQSRTSKMAFVKAMDFEMKNVVLDLMRDRLRQLFGNGVGILARVSGAVATGNTVIPLKAPGNVALPPGIATNNGAARLILDSQYIAIVRNATPTSATDSDIIEVKQVSSKAANLASITLSATSGADYVDGDMIINSPANTSGESSVNKENMGLLGLIDDGTYLTTLFGVSRTDYPNFKSTVVAQNGAFQLDSLQRVFDAADEKGGDVKGMHLIMHHSTRREYLNVMNPIRRFVNDMATNPDGGIKNVGGLTGDTLTYAEKPIHVERMCPLGMIFGFDKTYAERLIVTEGEWADDDGAILGRELNKDAYEARFRVFDNFNISRPDSCFRLDNIQVTYDAIAVR